VLSWSYLENKTNYDEKIKSRGLITEKGKG